MIGLGLSTGMIWRCPFMPCLSCQLFRGSRMLISNVARQVGFLVFCWTGWLRPLSYRCDLAQSFPYEFRIGLERHPLATVFSATNDWCWPFYRYDLPMSSYPLPLFVAVEWSFLTLLVRLAFWSSVRQVGFSLSLALYAI